MNARRNNLFVIAVVFCFNGPALGQHIPQRMPAAGTDSIALSRELSTVVISAFEEKKKITDQPVPLFYISGSDLSRSGSNDILPVINMAPGVRMEQRSPASYRLDIRGSSLRSPFGVRDVKIYYNGIPVTDPSGDTYLNQFCFADFGSVGIIKGPSGSSYGAGIGGVMLIKSPLAADNLDTAAEAGISYNAGSFGKQGMDAYINWGGPGSQNCISYSDLNSSGYRPHTVLHQQTFAYELGAKISDKQQFDFIAHYNDLYYETPGGLTLKEFEKDPRMARPVAGIFPSADSSRAAVYQKNLLIGMDQTYRFSYHFQNTTSLYGSYTNLINPTFRNYEYRKEPHFGGRTVFKYQLPLARTSVSLLAGAEAQQGYFSVKDFGNISGAPDTLQTDDHVNNFQALLFAQADIDLSKGWNITAGASLNFSNLQFISLYPAPVHDFTREFKNNLVPRIALLKKINSGLSVYASVSGGFSPPSVSELLPSTSVLNTTLQAEKGTDLEMGSRGYLWKHKFYYDVNGFLFNLTQSISQRRDSSGADYFVNAGGALQRGLEGYFLYHLFRQEQGFFRSVNIFTSQTWFHFLYRDYKGIGGNYSGNDLPGVAPYTAVTGMDILTRPGIETHITWNYTARIPLNDANTVYADPYHLINISAGYRRTILKSCLLKISAGVDNLLNERYSLGDDINAAGGRYYNTAAGINYYGSVSVKVKL